MTNKDVKLRKLQMLMDVITHRILAILTTFSILLLSSCSQKKEIGQFVYVDDFNTVHIDRACVSNMHGVEFVDTSSFTGYDGDRFEYSFCPKCVDEGAYSRLSVIMERNRIEEQKIFKPPLD